VDFSGVLEDANAFAVIKSSYTKHAALQQAGPISVLKNAVYAAIWA
jgi:hypothetical protein